MCFFATARVGLIVSCYISIFSLCCIAPVLAAKVIQGSEVTVGSSDQEAAGAVGALGSKHISTKVNVSLKFVCFFDSSYIQIILCICGIDEKKIFQYASCFNL